MNMRVSIAALLLSIGAAGCTRSFEIPLGEVRHLASGTVKTVGGRTESVDRLISIQILPRDGAVLLRPSEDNPEVIAYPKYDTAWEPVHSFKPVGPLSAPLARIAF